MPIENRDLTAGTRLVARHKGKEHLCEVVRTDDGLRYRLDGKDFSSPSSAGREVTKGVAVNGWRFWSLEGTLKERKSPKATKSTKKAPAAKAKKKAAAKPKGVAKKAASASARGAYGCGVCPEVFPTMKAATQHALTHAAA
jgi:hypothetical protein